MKRCKKCNKILWTFNKDKCLCLSCESEEAIKELIRIYMERGYSRSEAVDIVLNNAKICIERKGD